MRPFINATFGYYLAADEIPIEPDDIEVPERPSVFHAWNGQTWELDTVTQRSAIVKEFGDAVQKMMDEQARALGYDDMLSAVTYADEPAVPEFQREGRALRAWRSECWSTCYGILGQIESGARAVPDLSELLAELPTFAGVMNAGA